MDPIEAYIQQLESRMNAALAGLPPIEQVGLSQECGFAIRACKQVASEMKDVFTNVRAKVKDMEQTAENKRKEMRTALVAELAKDVEFLKAHELTSKADLDLAITAARNDEKGKVDTAVKEKVDGLKQTAERRKKVVADKIITSVACEALADEVFIGEDYMTRINKVGERLKKLDTLKSLAKDEKAQKQVAGYPITAEGDSAFEISFDIWKNAAKAPGTVADPLNPQNEGCEKKAVVLF